MPLIGTAVFWGRKKKMKINVDELLLNFYLCNLQENDGVFDVIQHRLENVNEI
jgi:hypothetical protein